MTCMRALPWAQWLERTTLSGPSLDASEAPPSSGTYMTRSRSCGRSTSTLSAYRITRWSDTRHCPSRGWPKPQYPTTTPLPSRLRGCSILDGTFMGSSPSGRSLCANRVAICSVSPQAHEPSSCRCVPMCGTCFHTDFKLNTFCGHPRSDWALRIPKALSKFCLEVQRLDTQSSFPWPLPRCCFFGVLFGLKLPDGAIALRCAVTPQFILGA
ncbi:hypothetical protein OH76DRAFT_372853 [Lentinus brumalis]|uniref:Uncharacterized protein n=1 Tax=Lentinus brumalis TaxID=2498619 RepID=A0A371DEH1_9APHY|nr:hypothetical protein OH76DRAFT_372853 [Polyporus brumalis]